MKSAIFAVVLAIAMPLSALAAGDTSKAPEPVPSAPTTEDGVVTTVAPAPARMIIFRSGTEIPVPSAIEVDGTVSCRIDGDTLRCTARRPAPAPTETAE